MPKASVIVPSYNRPELLPRAVHSILSQTFHDLEVVVVNDGGYWDDSLSEKFSDPRIRVIQCAHGGPGAARNRGIEASDSEYVAYLDDDDEWFSDHLERLVNFTISSKAAMVYGVAEVRMHGRRLRRWGDCEFNKFIQDGFHTTFPLSACLHRRDLLEQSGFFDEQELLIGPEDCEFIIRCSDTTSPMPTMVQTVVMHREVSMTKAPRDQWVDVLSYVIEKLDYMKSRDNWLMLYRAVVAADCEKRTSEYDVWLGRLTETLPTGTSVLGTELRGNLNLLPQQLKSYCREAIKYG